MTLTATATDEPRRPRRRGVPIDLDRRILEALRGAPDGLMRHQIHRHTLGAHVPSAVVSAALDRLEKGGLVSQRRGPTHGGPGRPASFWHATEGGARWR